MSGGKWSTSILLCRKERGGYESQLSRKEGGGKSISNREDADKERGAAAKRYLKNGFN